MGPTHAIVHVLADRLRRPVSTIHPWNDLAIDLEATPLDLVLVTLDIERAEDARIDVEGLRNVRTVSDLSSFVKQEMTRARGALRRSLQRLAVSRNAGARASGGRRDGRTGLGA